MSRANHEGTACTRDLLPEPVAPEIVRGMQWDPRWGPLLEIMRTLLFENLTFTFGADHVTVKMPTASFESIDKAFRNFVAKTIETTSSSELIKSGQRQPF